MRLLRDGGIFAMILLGTGWTEPATASTILNIPCPTIGYADFGDSALADSWTQNFGITNGSISVYVQGLEPSGGTINFYLTTALGATATLDDLVAFTSVEVPFALTPVTPFSDLDLGPGTYYLILADYTPDNTGVNGPDWNYYAGTNIDTAPGLTLSPMEGAFSLGPFAPAADFTPVEIAVQGTLSFTGTIVPATTPAPEPSSVLMFTLGLLAFGLVRIRSGRPVRVLRRVMREDEVARLGLIVAREAGFHRCRSGGFAVHEGSEPPAARRRVLRGIFDHKLNVRWGAGDERLGLAEDLVVFRGWDVTVVQSGDDRAVRVWKLRLAVGFNRHIVAQNGANAVQVACLVGDGDQLPVAVSRGNFCDEDRGGRVIGVQGRLHRKPDKTCQNDNGNQQEDSPLHSGSSFRTTTVSVYA